MMTQGIFLSGQEERGEYKQWGYILDDEGHYHKD